MPRLDAICGGRLRVLYRMTEAGRKRPRLPSLEAGARPDLLI